MRGARGSRWAMALLLVLAGVGSSCTCKGSQRAAPASLQGTWRAEGQEPEGPDGVRPRSWHLEFTFDDRGYRVEGYPPISQEGPVTVLEVEPPRYKLILEPGQQFEVELEPDGEAFVHGGFRYQRQRR
jgi:hypothetical protein